MATRKASKKKKQVTDYRHMEAERLNNPPAGLAWQDTEQPVMRRFEYDPHLDPQLVWAGKAERQSFEVEAPSIHVHERLSADDIIRSVLKEPAQPALFDYEELDRSKTVDFYRHEMGWENRLILGDSLVVMTSLLEKERLGGQVQMMYIDPPYGIKFNSNFQSRISQRTPSEGSDSALTREPEQIQAFRDTWSLDLHSYLTYLRDRLLLSYELLSDTGSIFVQINDKNMPYVRLVLEEVFGPENRCATVAWKKAAPDTRIIRNTFNYLLWFAKNADSVKAHALFKRRTGTEGTTEDPAKLALWADFPDGTARPLTADEKRSLQTLPSGASVFRVDKIVDKGEDNHFPIRLNGKEISPKKGFSWRADQAEMARLLKADRIVETPEGLGYKFYLSDYPIIEITNLWEDTAGKIPDMRFVVQTNSKIVERCILATTDPGDLVLDPTTGSGTTANAAERFGRRWITCDTSRVAVSIARERLLTTAFEYYELASPDRGVDAGFVYESVPHITLRTIAQDARLDEIPDGDGARGKIQELLRTGAPQEVLRDRPAVVNTKVRVCGPFTVEALSRYAVNPNQENVPPEPDDPQAAEPQDHVRTLLDALTKQGIPRRSAKPARVLRVDGLATAGALNAEGIFEAEDESEKSFAVSIGPRFGPITVQQIDEALHEAYGYDLVVFAGYAATAEAQQYVAKGKLGKFDVALLEANPDLLVADLLKQTPSSQTFRLFAAPDIKLNRNGDGEHTVEVLGVDIFDAATGETRFVGDEYIAAWFLDTDYDGLVFHVSQAFFPDGGWEKLAKTLKGTVDPELIEQLERLESLPFKAGEHKKAAVRVIDDAGTTSEVVLDLE